MSRTDLIPTLHLAIGPAILIPGVGACGAKSILTAGMDHAP